MSDSIESDYDTGWREGYEAASGAALAEVERLTDELRIVRAVLNDKVDEVELLRMELEYRAELFEPMRQAVDWNVEMRTIQAKEIDRLRGEIETWGRIWNDEALLAGRVEALRDGTAQL
jgi:hypothetical protein